VMTHEACATHTLYYVTNESYHCISPAPCPTTNTAALAGGIRFVIFSRARSASTSFVNALNTHPNVSCAFEIFGEIGTMHQLGRAHLRSRATIPFQTAL
jgi:hypothetical protein